MVNVGEIKADFIYIDGGKDYETVKMDTLNAYALLKKDAVVIINDIQSCINAIDDAVKETTLELVNNTETQRAYVKR